jgi:hypothetical protein
MLRPCGGCCSALDDPDASQIASARHKAVPYERHSRSLLAAIIGAPQNLRGLLRLCSSIDYPRVRSLAFGALAETRVGAPAGEEQTPQALGALQRAEIQKWWRIIKSVFRRAKLTP